MLSIRPGTNDLDNLDSLTADVMEAFRMLTETLTQPDTQTVLADGGHYTAAQVHTMLKATHKNVAEQVTMAFLVNFLPPNL